MTADPFSVLLIDDSYVTRLMFELIFEHFGLSLALVADSESALNYLERCTPAVIVVDLYLSDTDGWTLHDRIRAMGYTGAIVATTSYHTSRVWGHTLISGFDGYRPKPIDINNLVPYLYELWTTRQ